MTSDPDFWKRTVGEIDLWMIASRAAQEEGNRIFADIMQNIERYVGYRPVFLPRLVKSRNRLLEKAQAIHRANDDLMPKDIAVLMTDVAAGRLLVIGLRDIDLAYRWCADYQRNHASGIRFVGEQKIFLATAKAGGFRGLIQQTEISVSAGSQFPFELQIMTYLQHSWDQLQHGFYELMRKGSAPLTGTEQINQKFEVLSDRLYQLDRDLDTTKEAVIV